MNCLTSEMVATEFQAVVLAGGRGSRYNELTKTRPKCLLPIGPFPMIFYPLHMLQRHGFQEIIVVVLEDERLEIQQMLERTPIKVKLDFATLQSDKGTAQALVHISDRIKCDLVVVSCDTVTNIDLYKMLNEFRKNSATIVTQLFKSGLDAGTIVPGPKAKHKQERDLIGIQPHTNRLTFLASASDFDETLDLPYHLLHRYGHIVMHTQAIDSHIYILKKWIIDFLNGNDSIDSLKGEVIPYIVKKQMSKFPQQHIPPENEKHVNNSVANVNVKHDDIFHLILQNDLDRKIRDISLFNDSDNRQPFNDDLIRCYALRPQENCFGIRVNTILSYCAINQKIFDLWTKIFPSNAPSLISPHSNVCSTQMVNCAIADKATIMDKTSLTNCCIGPNSTINVKTRISNSVLMNDVTIEEGVIIENCVLCDKAIVRTGSNLKNCLIGSNHDVAENSFKDKAHLTNADGYMEIE